MSRDTDAIHAYQQLLLQRPDQPDIWYNLAILFRKTGQLQSSLACYQHALNRGIARPEEAHLNRGVIYSDLLHQYDAAERELLRALELNPAFIPALLNLANLQEDQGRATDAQSTYEKLLAIEPANAVALARYAGIKTFQSPEDPLIQRMRLLLQSPDSSEADRATLGFALGRALDNCGAYPEAFAAYAAANRHSRASAPPGTGRYDRVAEEEFVDRLIKAFPARAPVTAPPAQTPPAALAAHRHQPIFICGMFRSGSTLIEQLIAGQSDVTPGGELEFLPDLVKTALAPFPDSVTSLSQEQIQSLASGYLAALAQRFPGATRVTDKRPDNFLYIGLIKLLFPDARIVHTVRNPLDNCLSIYFLHLDQRMSYALDLADIGHHYVQYQRLMRHWKSLYGADIIDVDYDSYVHQPEPEAARLFTALGLERRAERPAQSAQAQAIRTASVWQVREPLYQRSSGRARHYEQELAALRESLGR